ncbi:hypothetical protein CPL00134L_CDS0032 [Escherichia phage Phagiculus]
MSNTTLGDVVRGMVDEALKSEAKEFHVPVKKIYQLLGGEVDFDSSDVDFKRGGRYEITKLKASYVANTASRMESMKDADYRARLSFGDMEFKDEVEYCAKITLIKGAIKEGVRNKTNEHIEIKAIESFKERILKLSPNIVDMEGDELSGAIKAIRMYQDMIKEMN